MKRIYILPVRMVLVLLATALWVAIVSAHGVVLVRSEPAAGSTVESPPEQVRAWFNEELDTDGSTLQVLDAEGRQVDNGDGGVDLYDPEHASMVVTLPPQLPAGDYTVRWYAVVAEDGDTAEGEFSFSIAASAQRGEQAAAPQPSVRVAPPRSSGLTLGWAAVVAVIVLLLIIGIGFHRRLQVGGKASPRQ